MSHSVEESSQSESTINESSQSVISSEAESVSSQQSQDESDTTSASESNSSVEAESFDVAEVSRVFHDLVNEERVESGVTELSYGEHLQAAAVSRSDEIAERFSHTRPNGETFHTTPGFELAGTIVGENLQKVMVSPSASPEQIAEMLFENWKKSPGHYENMMDGSYVYHAIQLDTYDDGDSIIIYSAQVFSN